MNLDFLNMPYIKQGTFKLPLYFLVIKLLC